MSQKTPTYVTPDTEPTSLSAFKNRACARAYTDNYIQPTPGEVKALIKLCNWSQTQVAKLTGVTYNPLKGSSTVRKWQTTSECNGLIKPDTSKDRFIMLLEVKK
jgi:hypothetical protein